MKDTASKVFRDDFSELYLVRGRKERLNGGPWRPVGWLAAEVLKYPSEPKEHVGRLSGTLAEIRSGFASPENDVHRLLSRVGRKLKAMRGHDPEWVLDSFEAHYGLLDLADRYEREREGSPEVPKPPAFVQRALKELSRTHEIAESFISRPSGPRGRAIIPMDGGRAVESIFRWVGCGRDEDCFRATPAGTVFLSASYGRARGYLRLCASCGRFALLPSRGFQRRYCDKCRSLMRSSDRVSGLPQRYVELWRRLENRMRRRGFKRLGLDTPQKRKQWRKYALQALYEVKTPEELKAWEQHFAPKGRPGRPRKQGDNPGAPARPALVGRELPPGGEESPWRRRSGA